MTPDGPTSVKSDRVGAVRRLANRSFRRKVGRFLVEGPQSVREAVAWRPDIIDEVFVSVAAPGPAQDVAGAARAAGLRVTTVPEPVLLAMTETVHPQGISAVCRFLDVAATGLLPGARLIVVLHEVRDPGNAGTILRTADAAGADAVILAGDSVDPYNGKCVRSSAGSLFHVPVGLTDDLPDLQAGARAAGLQVLGTAAGASRDLLDLQRDGSLVPPTLWVFGNEAHGLPVELRADIDVAIPIFGHAESLNLAAAAAVCLYATSAAQRR